VTVSLIYTNSLSVSRPTLVSGQLGQRGAESRGELNTSSFKLCRLWFWDEGHLTVEKIFQGPPAPPSCFALRNCLYIKVLPAQIMTSPSKIFPMATSCLTGFRDSVQGSKMISRTPWQRDFENHWCGLCAYKRRRIVSVKPA